MVFFQIRNTQAQDYHFSQFNTAPLYTSPALTGFMNARQRISIKYRNQWSSVLQDDAYKTMLISYDGRICPTGDVTFAYGINIVEDQIAGFNDDINFPRLKTHHYLGSIAFHVRIARGLTVSGGLQGGLLRYELDKNNLKFENQFDGFVGFDTTLPTMENFLENNAVNLLDLGGGVLLYDGKRSWNIGVAFHHINPKKYYAFTTAGEQGNNQAKVRWVIHGMLPFKIKNQVFAFRKMTTIQLPHWQTNAGFDIRFEVSKNKANPVFNGIIIGIGTRFSNRYQDPLVADAMVFSARTDIGDGWLLGFGYDWNISPLRKASNSRGGVEMSLVYEFPIGKKAKCLNCPDINKSIYGKGLWQIF